MCGGISFRLAETHAALASQHLNFSELAKFPTDAPGVMPEIERPSSDNPDADVRNVGETRGMK